MAVVADGDVVLGDLVVLGQVGVEVVLAVEHRRPADPAVESQADGGDPLDRPSVRDRQRPRKAQAHRTDVRVRLLAEGHRAAAEHLRLGLQLDVGLDSDDRFPSHHASPSGGRASNPASRSSSAATANILSSPRAGAITCIPIGSPASSTPIGTDIAGSPVRLQGKVHTSDRYMASGSSTLAPSSKATVGLVGETNTSAFS